MHEEENFVAFFPDLTNNVRTGKKIIILLNSVFNDYSTNI